MLDFEGPISVVPEGYLRKDSPFRRLFLIETHRDICTHERGIACRCPNTMPPQGDVLVSGNNGGFMHFGCALFVVVVAGMACAIIATLSALFWHLRDLEPHEKQVISNWKRLKKAAR